MMFSVFLLCHLPFLYGFLLDTSYPQQPNGQTSTNGQLLTVSEFYEAKKQQQNAFEMLQQYTTKQYHDMDKTLALLASQLQQKLNAMEIKEIQVNSQLNDSAKIAEMWMQNYNAMETNNTQLQQKLDNLQTKYQILERSNTVLVQKFDNLDANYNDLHGNNTQVLQKFDIIQNKLSEILSNSNKLGKQVEDLNQLKNVQQLHSFNDLQNQVQRLSAETNVLKRNEQARRQDFLALYNETVMAKQTTTALDSRFRTFVSDQNASLTNLNTSVQKHFEKIGLELSSQNASFRTISLKIQDNVTKIEHLIAENSERVTVTSCVSSPGTKNNGHILRFDDVRSQVGISSNTMSAFKSSGKFKCETEGLYQISVWVASGTNGGQYTIYKNDQTVTSPYTGPSADTTTAVVNLELQANDLVWVQVKVSMYVYTNTWSCMSVVKLK